MKTPLALVEVSYHHPKTGANSREWVVVKTEAAARGLDAHRVVFLRDPTEAERASVEACASRSIMTPKVFTLSEMLARAGTAPGARSIGSILRGEP